MGAAIAGLWAALKPVLVGKASEYVVEGMSAGATRGAKGLMQSKTANLAHMALAAKVTAVWALPLPAWLQYTLTAAVFIEWGVQLYLRVVTKEPIAKPGE